MPNTETINWGWLNDATGNKFAPITFYEKICEYPDRSVGVISEIPQYEVWGENGIEIKGRIRVKVR